MHKNIFSIKEDRKEGPKEHGDIDETEDKHRKTKISTILISASNVNGTNNPIS
jgi:hypothetical protein